MTSVVISLPSVSKNSGPNFFCAAEDSRDEFAQLVRRRSGRNLLLLCLADSGQHFRATNEQPRIDAKSPAD